MNSPSASQRNPATYCHTSPASSGSGCGKSSPPHTPCGGNRETLTYSVTKGAMTEEVNPATGALQPGSGVWQGYVPMLNPADTRCYPEFASSELTATTTVWLPDGLTGRMVNLPSLTTGQEFLARTDPLVETLLVRDDIASLGRMAGEGVSVVGKTRRGHPRASTHLDPRRRHHHDHPGLVPATMGPHVRRRNTTRARKCGLVGDEPQMNLDDMLPCVAIDDHGDCGPRDTVSLGKLALRNTTSTARGTNRPHRGRCQLGCQLEPPPSPADYATPCRPCCLRGNRGEDAPQGIAARRIITPVPHNLARQQLPHVQPERHHMRTSHPSAEAEFAVSANGLVDAPGPFPALIGIGRVPHDVAEHCELGLCAVHPVLSERIAVSPPPLVVRPHQPRDSATRSHSGTLHVDFATLTPSLSATVPGALTRSRGPFTAQYTAVI